jgi:hypothetical protein
MAGHFLLRVHPGRPPSHPREPAQTAWQANRFFSSGACPAGPAPGGRRRSVRREATPPLSRRTILSASPRSPDDAGTPQALSPEARTKGVDVPPRAVVVGVTAVPEIEVKW